MRSPQFCGSWIIYLVLVIGSWRPNGSKRNNTHLCKAPARLHKPTHRRSSSSASTTPNLYHLSVNLNFQLCETWRLQNSRAGREKQWNSLRIMEALSTLRRLGDSLSIMKYGGWTLRSRAVQAITPYGR